MNVEKDDRTLHKGNLFFFFFLEEEEENTSL